MIINLTPSYDQLPIHTKRLKVLLIIHGIIGYLFETLVFIVGWSLTQIFIQEGFFSFSIKALIPFLSYLFFNPQIRQISLYGRWAIPFAFALALTGNPLVLLGIGSVSAYYLGREKIKTKKISYGIVVIFSLFIISKLLLSGENWL